MIDFSMVAPEILIAVSSLLLLLLGVVRGEKSFPLVCWLAVAVIVVAEGMLLAGQSPGTTGHDMFATGSFQRLVKIILMEATGLALIVAAGSFVREQDRRPEYPVLVLFALLGMMLMVSANDLMMLYVGIELQNLPLYVLVSLRRDAKRSSEAGLKYFTLGAMSSAILLFGLSFVYGFSGTTSFSALSSIVSAQCMELPLGLTVGLAFVLTGLAFKISAAPFHMWTPDVYQGAPTPVTAFLGSAAKVAALSLVLVVFGRTFGAAAALWQPVVMVLAVISMLWGALAGLRQTNLKRLMAYSAIVNVGTILVGLVVLGQKGDGAVAVAGVQGMLVYLAMYAAGTLGVLGGLALLGHKDKPVDEIADLAGLSQTQPAMALALAVALFSLAGVPPLAGFFGKYFVLLAAVQGGLVWLAVVGVLASVIAAAYYLRVIKVMYFDAHKGLPVEVISGRIPKFCVMLLCWSLAAFILYPAPLIEQARLAAEGLLVR